MSEQWNDTEIWKAIREAQPVPGSALPVDRVFNLMRRMRDELTANHAAELQSLRSQVANMQSKYRLHEQDERRRMYPGLA